MMMGLINLLAFIAINYQSITALKYRELLIIINLMKRLLHKTIITSLTSVSAIYFAQDSLQKAKTLNEVVLLGTRSSSRTIVNSPVPVDIIELSKTLKEVPQNSVSSTLNFIVPSFTSTSHTVNDGTDFVDSAQIRGLGPDQVLVLLNGKRRHQSSLVNVTLTPGRGSVGTDLNAIPAFALERIEVLRDGASAQYGSDAIAGVINLELKKRLGFSGQLYLGGYASSVANNHTGGVDGENIGLDLNYGTRIGKKGFINFTSSLQYRNPYSRAGEQQADLFNGYNAISYRAAQDNINIDGLYKNINNTPNTNQIINYIHQYSNKVDYFSAGEKQAIQNAGSISALQQLLSKDYTTQELAYRGLERSDFNMRIGQSRLKSAQLYFNTEIPISDQWKVFSFGGYSLRNGNAGGFYRFPNNPRAVTSLYPNGFLPQIESTIYDYSLAAGVKGKWNDWNINLSNTFGQNNFKFGVTNTLNASLLQDSPTYFEAGSLGFLQNTLNLDFQKKFDVLKGLNLAFGGEYRHEKYSITPGKANSYQQYDIFGNPVTEKTATKDIPTDFFGNARPGGAQVFPGYRPENEVSKGRNSVAAYLDAELEATDWLFLEGALRYENYTDFGSTFNYKLASNIRISPKFNWRLAGSTGFRAPSLAQLYYSSTSTLINGGKTTQVGTFRNDSDAARQLGIPQLKQETSKSVSTGFNWKIPSINLLFTVDAYFTRIDNRVVLTDLFTRPQGNFADGTPERNLQQIFDSVGAEAANFFANAIDTETKGIDITVSQRSRFAPGISLENNLGINLNQTRKVGAIKASEQLQSQINSYFSEENRIYFEEAVPRFKAILGHNLKVNKFNFYVRNAYFGKVTDANIVDANLDGVTEPNEHVILGGKLVTDLSAGYQFNKNVLLTVGANNIFNVQPTQNPNINSLTAGNQFLTSRQVSQFGIGGRYLFARINFDF